MKAFEEENYTEAVELYNDLIDNHGAKNPFMLYMRGKSYHNLETRADINCARRDFIKADFALQKIRKANAFVMRLKIHYTHGLLEYEKGDNIIRALHHFQTFMRIIECFTSKREIRKQMPEFDDMENQCMQHIE
jgi:hypothetical protein